MAFDIYQTITDRIISMIEKEGKLPWTMPWVTTGGSNCAVRRENGKPYSLLNQILLGRPGEYITYKQCQAEGGNVKKGEKSSIVVYWNWIDKKDENGHVVIGKDGKPEQVPFLKYYNVFHIDQCEGIKPKWTAEAQLPENELEESEKAESIIAGYVDRCKVKFLPMESNKAYYQPSTDTVIIPAMNQYKEVAEYYSTAFHELTHSTGHKDRLNRITGTAAFGSADYSKEELVAEIGACTLNNICGLETATSFRNSAAYIENWLKALKNDKKLIVSASGKAEKAVALILG